MIQPLVLDQSRLIASFQRLTGWLQFLGDRIISIEGAGMVIYSILGMTVILYCLFGSAFIRFHRIRNDHLNFIS